MLTASILLTPLVVIPVAVHATRWLWLLLLCVPVACLLASLRRQFEHDEWFSRDLARSKPTPEHHADLVETIDEAANVGMAPRVTP